MKDNKEYPQKGVKTKEELIVQYASRCYEHIANEPQFDCAMAEFGMPDLLDMMNEYANQFKQPVSHDVFINTSFNGYSPIKMALQELADGTINESECTEVIANAYRFTHLQPANNDYAVKVIEERIKELEIDRKNCIDTFNNSHYIKMSDDKISEAKHLIKLLS